MDRLQADRFRLLITGRHCCNRCGVFPLPQPESCVHRSPQQGGRQPWVINQIRQRRLQLVQPIVVDRPSRLQRHTAVRIAQKHLQFRSPQTPQRNHGRSANRHAGPADCLGQAAGRTLREAGQSHHAGMSHHGIRVVILGQQPDDGGDVVSCAHLRQRESRKAADTERLVVHSLHARRSNSQPHRVRAAPTADVIQRPQTLGSDLCIFVSSQRQQ